MIIGYPIGARPSVAGPVLKEAFICFLSGGNMVNTLTNLAATVLNPMNSNNMTTRVNLSGRTVIYLNGYLGTAGASGSRLAMKFSLNTAPAYTWIMANGDAEPANGAANPGTGNDAAWFAVDLTVIGSIHKEITVPASCRGVCSIGMIAYGGDGAADPNPANLFVTALV